MFLIRRELPKGFAFGYRWTLVAMRERGRDDQSPYVGFESVQAASEFIATLPPTIEYSLVESTCLGLDTYIQPNARSLVFVSNDQLRAYRANSASHDTSVVAVPVARRFSWGIRELKDWRAARQSVKIYA